LLYDMIFDWSAKLRHAVFQNTVDISRRITCPIHRRAS
jgi:hypothetical protein